MPYLTSATTCWTQSLHEYLVASPPSGADEQAIRALLCTPRSSWMPPPPEQASALRTWLAKSPVLTHRHALSSALPYTEDFHRLGGPLLTWASTRPWCCDIEILPVLERWRRILNEPNLYSDTLATNMAYATHLMVDILFKLPKPIRLVAADAWTTKVIADSPHNVLWQPNMYSPDVHRLVMASWPDMHTIATLCLGSKGTQLWEASVKKAFDNVSFNHAQNALAIVCSPLPDDVKLRGALCTNAVAWLHPELLAELAPLLRRIAPDPAVRIHSVPWAFASSFDDRRLRVDFQRELCEAYCPELIPLFALSQVDWTDRVSACRVASMFTPEKETFDLVGLVGSENQPTF